MATYSRLLIETGSGIVDHGKQSPKDPGASLIIGLGGTGSDLAIKVKKEVFKQLQPDDPDASIPTHNNIKYLIVDSDMSKVNSQRGLVSDIEKSEYFDISNNSITTVFANKETLKGRPELYWLNYEDISIRDASAGAGGIRQVGRYLLVDRAEQLYNKIKASMQAALIGTNGKLHVHICAGISGGTGSGTFIDVCYLVRRALQEIGKAEAKVCGYFFLPDVNLSVPEVANNPLISEYIKVNGYSALKELDYCMNFHQNGDSFRMNYGFTKVNDIQQPVDLCYLVSTKDSEGREVEDSYKYAMGVVSDFIISYLAQVKLPEGADPDNESEGLTLEGHIANIVQAKGRIKLQSGSNTDYNILGSAVAVMPLSEIATYLGAKLFEKYDDLFDRTPTEKELDEFIQHTQLGYDPIKKEVNKGCQPQLTFPDGFDAKAYKQNGNASFVKRADDFLAKNNGQIQENAKNLLDELKGYEIPENSTSLISRTYKEICELYATKMEYGPIFAYKLLLGGNNKNLIHRIDGYITRNKELLDAELRQSELRDDEYKSAKMRMDSSNMLNEGTRIKEYKNALNNLYVHLYRVELHRQIGTVLQKYKEQVLKLGNEYFNVLVEVFETLKNTFAENMHILTEGKQVKNRYNWNIVDIKEIQEALDENVKELDVDQSLYRLMNNLLKNVKLWINNDENNITKLVSEFVLDEFKEATQKTITDYLRQKYQVSDMTMLAQKIEQEIFAQELQRFSTPKFWLTSTYRNNIVKKSTISVPFDSVPIVNAAESYKNNTEGEFTIRKTGITDKISMMRFYSGLPLYAYHAMPELEAEYQSDSVAGKHLYETEAEDWRKKLPSPLPASFENPRRDEKTKQKYSRIKEGFEKAKEQGIVFGEETGDWFCIQMSTFDIDKFVDEMGGYEADGKFDAVKAKKICDALSAKKDELKGNAKKVKLPKMHSQDGCEYQVMMDLYCKAPVLNSIVEEQILFIQKLDEEIVKINERMIGVAKDTNVKKDFLQAIFAGVLTYGKSRIVYSYNEFGMDKEVVLQNSEMELGDTGAYCAFETYKSLSDDVKKKIIAETKKRIDADESPEIDAAIRDLSEKMPLRIQKYLMSYDESKLEHEPIKRFYEDFMKELEIFKMSQI